MMNETRSIGSRTGKLVVVAMAAAVVLFLVAPVVIVVIVSFSASDYLQFPPPGLSLKWYSRFWMVASWRESILVSLRLAGTTALLATTCGVAAAMALTRLHFRGKGLLYALFLSPMIVPTIVTAIGFYLVAARLGLVGSVTAMAVGESALAVPIVVIIVSATLQGIDARLEQAALGLGAGRWYTFRRVTLPLIAPGVLSAALFTFLAAFDALLIPLFLSGVRHQTLTVRIWNSLQVDLDPTIAAVSSVLIAITVVVLTASAFITRREGTRA